MLTAGVTGGIGTGKTTFARLLEARGAVVIDADALGRLALAPGAPAWRAVVGQFGNEMIVPNSMEIDRRKLADVVFKDKNKLVALNEIVHPVILAGVADSLEALEGTDSIVVIDAALIVELGLDKDVDVLVVVAADRDVREQRVMTDRGMSLPDVRARVAVQNDPEDLKARADIVVTNNGSIADLERDADRVWTELRAREIA
ncbi:MAG: dephospho-CoA kinase [Actinobacteria bacterium]|nr:dephospho-CoA kinase [Actinomycetota bacterium]